jgi:hypothetical protein
MNAAQTLRATDQMGSHRRPFAALLAALLGMAALTFVTPSASAETAAPDHLVIAAVWGANSDTAQWTNDWIELYNPTGQDIALGTVAGGAVTSSNYSLCYRGVATSPQKCSTTVKLSGTVKAHHYFFVWYANAHSPADDGTYPSGFTPDLDVAVKTAANGQQQGSNMGGCNTGGQVLLLNPNASGASNAATFVGDLSSATAKTDGVVDGVGWYNGGATQPNAAETNGAAPVTGFNAGTTNACVISRTFTDGVPVDTDVNKTDFSIASPASFNIHSQISDHVAVASIADSVISIDEAMAPIQVHASKGTGALTYAAAGLPDGVSIDPSTGIISGRPEATDDLKAYPVTVTVTDSSPTGSESATTGFNLTLSNLLRVDPVANASGHKGAALTPIQVSAHGGTPGYSYAASGLPAGVTIDPSTGLISGTPTASVGRYGVHVTVTDGGAGALAQSVSIDFTLLVQPKTTGPGGSDPLVGLRINEVKTTGTPADDWVELYNTGAAATGASVNLVDDDGDSYTLPTQDIAAGGYVVIDGGDLHAAGVDLDAQDTLDLTESDDSLLDETSWTTNVATSWARYPDGSGDFGASSHATKGATNAAPTVLSQNDLVVAAVYGADGTTFNSDWVELYNPTDHDISLGTIDPSTGTVTPNYYQCYRSNSSTTCSSMKLYGTVLPHHYFLIWNGHNADATADAHGKGVPPAGITPDLDFRYGSNDTNSAATKAANDPSGQTNNGFGGCNTGGQLWLLNASSNGVAPGGNLATSAAKATVVDGVGWTAAGVTQPAGFETTGLNSGTNNACVITRTFKFGLPLDSDNNNADFTTLADPASFSLHSQASTHVGISPIADTEISLDEAMPHLQVQATKVYNDLTFAAIGLPDGITIDPTTGLISGTPAADDAVGDHAVTITVTDGVPSDTATASFTLKVSKVLRLDPIADVSLSKGSPLTAIHAAAHGGTPAYTYAATGLPTGVAIDPTTGVISGTPTGSIGRSLVHVTVTDSGVGDALASVSRDFTFIELPPLGGPASGDPLAGLTINEIRATGKAANDWVELYNAGDAVHAGLGLVDTEGDTYTVPAQDIASHGFVVVDGTDLAAAGLDLDANDTLYLTESDGTLLDKTTWTAYQPTSWARTTDGAGTFAVSAFPTRGAANSGAPVIGPNDLLVSEVNYDNNSTDWYEYSEVTNTTDHPIDFAAYGITVTKSGAVMTLHDPSDTTQTSPTIDPVIPAHATRIFWWVENQYFGVKTTSQFLSNYGLPQSTPVVLVYGFSSMANSGGDHSFYISLNQGATPITQAWVDTPCAANTFNGASVCPATNNNSAEHYAVPSDRSNALATPWYNSLFAGGDDINHALKTKLSSPLTVDLEQVGFTRVVKIASATSTAVTLHNTSNGTVDLAGYVLQRNGAGTGYKLPSGTDLAAGDELAVASADSGLSFAGRDYVTLLAPRGYAYSDSVGIADTTGPLLKTLAYDASSGSDPVIDPTTGLPLPPAGGLYRPAGISAHNGTVYVSNTGDNLVATMAGGSNAIIAGSLAGYGELGNEGPATDAQLYQPGGTALDSEGNVYIADSGDNVVRMITTDGKIHRFAGTGVAGGAGSTVTATSTPLSVNLWHPNDVVVDGNDNVFITDTSDNRILEVTAGGTVEVVAGTGKPGYSGDGSPGASGRLSQPSGVAVDAKGNLYVADSSNNVVRRVDGSTGVITTVAGNYAAGLQENDCLGGYGGDGGPATSALLNDPQGVAVDGAGDLFIADTFNNAIREVLPDGTITTVVNVGAVAGSGNASPVGNGSLPGTTTLNTPYALDIDPVTNALYIADTRNNVVDEVVHAAEAGDTAGPVEPTDQVAVTGSGVASSACAALANGPVVGLDAPTVTGTLALGATLTADPGTWTPAPDSYTYQWLRDGVAIDGATTSTYVVTSDDTGHALAVAVTAVKEDFGSASATSAAVTIPVPQPGTLTTATPTITGTVKVGLKVTVEPGAWKAGSASVTSFGYQWLRNGVAIPKATASTYTVTPADFGKKVSVRVTGSYPGYTTASVASSVHSVAAGTLRTAVPTIAGKARVGRLLVAKAGTWKAGVVVLTGSHLRYQWFVNGKRISGATHATFLVRAKYKGKRLAVKVTGSSTGYATVTRSSASTTKVRVR